MKGWIEMKPVFTAEDFTKAVFSQDSADIANAKISAILKDAQRVYGFSDFGDWHWSTIRSTNDTHTALIWSPSIEEIVQEHECVPLDGLRFVSDSKCKFCGEPIEPVGWKRKEK